MTPFDRKNTSTEAHNVSARRSLTASPGTATWATRHSAVVAAVPINAAAS